MLLPPIGREKLIQITSHLRAGMNFKNRTAVSCEKFYVKNSQYELSANFFERNKPQQLRGVGKFECTTCKRKFKDGSNLNRHELTHTKDKSFICVGCQNRFAQSGSLQRHQKKCRAYLNLNIIEDKSIRKNYCRVCGMVFKYKSALLEHCVRQHSNSNNSDNEQNTINVDTNRMVDNIVDDILSAEDDYMTMSTSQDLMSFSSVQTQNYTAPGYESLMQVELLKEMNQLHSLDDELLYNDLYFDGLQSNQTFNMNTNDIDYSTDNTELFEYVNENKNIDQDFLNTLSYTKDSMQDELLNLNSTDRNQPLTLTEDCATIFESDVDLEVSTNLAANLNQLIGENSVQYISTEDDDTFIISLNSEIDAARLTDMLNKVEVVNKIDESEYMPEVSDKSHLLEYIVPFIKPTDKCEKTEVEKKVKTKPLYFCNTCGKIFKKKDNFKSHLATHDASLRRHGCPVCGRRFGYRSSLNKHVAAAHEPRTRPDHACSVQRCDKHYPTAWQLKNHIKRDHEMALKWVCERDGCGKKFYKKSDLVVHTRYHTGERPYQCESCQVTFGQVSHLRRHRKRLRCAKYHRGDRPYQCESCRQTFRRVSHLREHREQLRCAKSGGCRKNDSLLQKPKKEIVTT
ncbi:zinc finger protein Xfin-like isoform X2 [Leptidea sinapis]|uniref:zinc finger protein Xfin-like isoform X2 n=1 Tax=Leptidea sinapis TaxID=189913 RepID=UPI0021C34EE2|nr:zinc finger protein Xfin-like isoform X2 [Leptidea sinapis]